MLTIERLEASGLHPSLIWPESPEWEEAQQFEIDNYGGAFELSGEQFREIYDPFKKRSLALCVRARQNIVGIARATLPLPGASSFSETGFQQLAPSGTPYWGKLDIDPSTLRQYDHLAPASIEIQTNVVKQDYRGTFVIAALQSMIADLPENVCKAREIPPSKATIFTSFVRTYLRSMIKNYPDAVIKLGKETSYGETDPSKFTTAVIMPVARIRKAEADKPSDKQRILLSGLLRIVSPDIDVKLRG